MTGQVWPPPPFTQRHLRPQQSVLTNNDVVAELGDRVPSAKREADACDMRTQVIVNRLDRFLVRALRAAGPLPDRSIDRELAGLRTPKTGYACQGLWILLVDRARLP